MKKDKLGRGNYEYMLEKQADKLSNMAYTDISGRDSRHPP